MIDFDQPREAPATVPVFVLTGQLAAGKSTIARRLLDAFDYGLHIDVDGVREMVTSGMASPLTPGDETERQFRLALRASGHLAAVYGRAGFAVAIEGAIDPWQAEQVLVRLGLEDSMVGIELFPSLEVALDRNKHRTNKQTDTSILDDAIRAIDRELRDNPPPESFTRIDNSNDLPDETAQRILAISDERFPRSEREAST